MLSTNFWKQTGNSQKNQRSKGKHVGMDKDKNLDSSPRENISTSLEEQLTVPTQLIMDYTIPFESKNIL